MEGVSALLASCPTAGLAGGLGVTACAAAGVVLYRIARRVKPTHTMVNCWFCNHDTLVPYGNRNCWDCPHCEQYNGFQENGDYNKPIPAQYMEHQTSIVAVGLLTCLLAMLLAGRIRLRRIDAFSTCLWALLLGLHLAEHYLQAASPGWLDTLKFSTTSLCCLVGFTAAVATRKSTGPRRFRPRRYFSGDSASLFPSSPSLAVPYPSVTSSPASLFIPTPPGFLPLTKQQLFRSPRRVSPSSLPGRLSRALSLGTIPPLTRTDSGYLFSGSRPPSRVSPAGEVSLSAPSVASSVASSSGSLRHRRPLISPARLNLKGQKLLLFSSPGEAPNTPSSSEEFSPPNGSLFIESPQLPQRNHTRDTKHTMEMRSMLARDSARSSHSIKKEDESSQSSTCVVDTTTKGCSEETTPWKARVSPSLVRGLLAVSLAVNALFTSAYLYQSLR